MDPTAILKMMVQDQYLSASPFIISSNDILKEDDIKNKKCLSYQTPSHRKDW
jgi:hypothetical protein